jgi:lipoprotein-anchoring transpeptidase ErfK/SrfK
MRSPIATFALTMAVACSGYAFAADQLSQPLTRADCDKAGMKWNDRANVCRSKAAVRAPAKGSHAPEDAQGESQSGQSQSGSTSEEPAPKVLITIDKASQQMSVLVDGIEQYKWPVSTGRRGYSTPSGTYTPTSMNEEWYSQQWDDSPMPHSIFFMKDGHAIHGSYEVKTLGKPVSHGCVRISPQNAATLYELVEEKGIKNTQVVLIGTTPGGESKVASHPAHPRYWDDTAPWFAPGEAYFPPPRNYQSQRRGFFERLFQPD